MTDHAEDLRSLIRQLADNEHENEFADMSADARRARLYELADRAAHAVAAPQPPAEAQGWYCAHCQRGVDAREVTYSEQHEVCAHSWHDYGTVPRAWCSRCNAVAVAGHEDRPYGVLSVSDDGKYRTDPIQQPASEVYVDFPQVGTAGPLAVVDGKVTLPDATMNDLIRHARTGYVEQPAAVDDGAVFRLAVWMAKQDGHDDPHHLIWEGSPPEPWGEVWNRYEDNARAALTAALAAQQGGKA